LASHGAQREGGGDFARREARRRGHVTKKKKRGREKSK